jgi:hypothetical protein
VSSGEKLGPEGRFSEKVGARYSAFFSELPFGLFS